MPLVDVLLLDSSHISVLNSIDSVEKLWAAYIALVVSSACNQVVLSNITSRRHDGARIRVCRSGYGAFRDWGHLFFYRLKGAGLCSSFKHVVVAGECENEHLIPPDLSNVLL